MDFDIVINNNYELTNKEETIMTNQEKAYQYFLANNKPIYNLCPIVKQRWETSDGTMYWDSKEMIRRPAIYAERYVSTVKGRYEGSYIRYVDELDAIEIARVAAKGGRGQNGVPMDWHYPYAGHRCLIFKGDEAAYLSNGGVRKDGKYYSNEVVRLLMVLARTGMYQNNEAQEKELRRAGIVFDTDYSYYVWRFKEYYMKNWMPRNKSKKSAGIDSIELGDVNFTGISVYSVMVIQPAEDYMVFRKFTQDYRDHSKYNESFRIYVDKKGKPTVTCKHYGSTKWDITTASIHCSTYSSGENDFILIGAENIDNWDSLKYLKNVLDFNSKNIGEELVAILRHPILEQLSKSGYPKIAEGLTKENHIVANLKYYFRVEKETKQPLYKLLGVNKWLLKAIEEMPLCNNGYYTYDGRMSVLHMIKYFYDRFDISDIDKETIETLVSEFSKIDLGALRELCGYRRWGWHRNGSDWDEVSDETRKEIFKLIHMNRKDKDHDILRYYIDIKRLYDEIEHKPEINFNRFTDFHSLEIVHDALVEIKVQEDAERQARYNEEKRRQLENQRKGFEKLQKDRVERFNAESDKYLIRVPNALEEITKEGMILHHCVGSYLNTHATGRTNIIFLRKKESPDTPFYTIEVDVMDRVVQIHGSHNKWLGNDPEAIPFVWKWIKDRNLDCPKNILLNLGAGYSAARESLDESYLTKEVI